ncbi:MAG: hypothetical protein ACRENE_30885 [Polyangiaceae bacterium]
MNIDPRAHATATILAGVALLGSATAPLAACVTDSNRCPPGYVYTATYDACLQQATRGDGGASTEAGAASEAGGGDASSAGDGGLGASCNASSDCPSSASYCLKDPTAAPTDPGVCTIPGCTAAACGSDYSCCDCTAGLVSALMAWPRNVCAPASNKSTLVQFGCTCQ